MSTSSIYTPLWHTSLYFHNVLVISQRHTVDFTLLTFYTILGQTQRINMQKLHLDHCIWKSERSTHSPHLLKAVTFFVSCYKDKFLHNYCTWQVMIPTLAWIKRVVTCCAYRTSPERPLDFLSVCDRGNKKTTEHTHRVASRHSLAHLHSHLRSCRCCWLRQSLCVSCCASVYACAQRKAPSSFRRLTVGTHHQPTPPHWGLPATWCGHRDQIWNLTSRWEVDKDN